MYSTYYTYHLPQPSHLVAAHCQLLNLAIMIIMNPISIRSMNVHLSIIERSSVHPPVIRDVPELYRVHRLRQDGAMGEAVQPWRPS